MGTIFGGGGGGGGSTPALAAVLTVGASATSIPITSIKTLVGLNHGLIDMTSGVVISDNGPSNITLDNSGNVRVNVNNSFIVDASLQNIEFNAADGSFITLGPALPGVQIQDGAGSYLQLDGFGHLNIGSNNGITLSNGAGFGYAFADGSSMTNNGANGITIDANFINLQSGSIRTQFLPTADPADGTNSLWMDPITRILKVGT